MQYGYFDNARREYVIDRVDVPVSWTNYLGTEKTGTVISQNAGGYMFHDSPENHRITRFRPNGVPLDRPGHYVYLRDNADAKYWSVSWQPTGTPQDAGGYTCRHGLSYSTFSCTNNGIDAQQTLFIPRGEAVELWDIQLHNTSAEVRDISVFPYCEFSFNIIEIDNQNFQMSLYCSGSSYAHGVIEVDNFYNPSMYHYMTSDFEPDSYDCLRDAFIGVYHSESNPVGVQNGVLSGSHELGNNHCGALCKRLVLQPGQKVRLTVMLGVGDRKEGLRIRQKYSDHQTVDAAFAELASFWDARLDTLQVKTPNEGMNTMLNTWNLYQAETNVNFSRFASFIEVGGRTGLGYRDTAQDAMCVPASDPKNCRRRIIDLCRGLTQAGYGLHLFDPSVFDPDRPKVPPFKSPTVKPEPKLDDVVHGLEDTCSDDALWLVPAICEYIKETGEYALVDEVVTYADGGSGTIYEHMCKILDFSALHVGQSGICKGLRADWNDCLNLGGGESALVSFLHYWALGAFIELAGFYGRQDDVRRYQQMADTVRSACESQLWDGQWFIRGITKKGIKIGTSKDAEGKVHLESNAWAVISQAASHEHAVQALDSVHTYLASDWGLHLNAPAYGTPNDDIGFLTRVYKGIKENGAIFSHPNPWAWVAESMVGNGERAMQYYDSLCPANQNDKIEVRQAEPYSYCQFVMGRDHSAHGRARHPWLTGSAGWAYFAATQYLLGIRPSFDTLEVDPCIPAGWDGFEVTRIWRGARYEIHVHNEAHVQKGVAKLLLDGIQVSVIPAMDAGTDHVIDVYMG